MTRRVLPAIENAILAGQDLVLLGERGQAKTRLARLLVGLLDDAIPVVRGGELNDDPYAPISPSAVAIVARARRRDADRLAAARPPLRREARHAGHHDRRPDRRGRPDPGRGGPLSRDEMTLHYGLIPRSNRGIFAINELPDLAERIQVGLLNILEERDVQIRGFTVRLPLDLFVVASANPEDYTSRGRIITPLKDRLGSQVRTHYPRTLEHELAIVRQEKQRFDGGDDEPAIACRASWRSCSPSSPISPAARPRSASDPASASASPSRTPRSSRPRRSAGPSVSARPWPRRASATSARSSRARSARSSSSRSATTPPRSGSSSG